MKTYKAYISATVKLLTGDYKLCNAYTTDRHTSALELIREVTEYWLPRILEDNQDQLDLEIRVIYVATTLPKKGK